MWAFLSLTRLITIDESLDGPWCSQLALYSQAEEMEVLKMVGLLADAKHVGSWLKRKEWGIIPKALGPIHQFAEKQQEKCTFI